MFFVSQNIKNRQQNKLVNIVNGNDLIKHNYWPHLYLTICFLNPDVYLLKTGCYSDLYMAYIFLNARLLQPFLKMCVFSMGWNLKHWTLLDIWVQIISYVCFYMHFLIILLILKVKVVTECSNYTTMDSPVSNYPKSILRSCFWVNWYKSMLSYFFQQL